MRVVDCTDEVMVPWRDFVEMEIEQGEDASILHIYTRVHDRRHITISSGLVATSLPEIESAITARHHAYLNRPKSAPY